jgi:toxin-antitoxin system PIN domain toxin
VIVPDVNLLLYAHVDAFPQHARARAWWEATLSGSAPVGLPDVVVFGFLRLATSRRVFAEPMTAAAAVATVRSWLAVPGVRSLPPGPRHLSIALDLVLAVGTAGALTTDIQLAAHALETGATLATNDADFRRFPGLRLTNPVG